MPAKDFLKPKQKEQLQATLRDSNSPAVREGALILLLIDEGRTSKEITDLIGCSYRTVAYWNIHGDPDKMEVPKVPPSLTVGNLGTELVTENSRPTKISSTPDEVESLGTKPVMENFRPTQVSSAPDEAESLGTQLARENLHQTIISSKSEAVESLKTQLTPEKFHKTTEEYIRLLDVKVLEDTFALVKPQATDFAYSFYNNLFDGYPQLQPLFANTNMAEQEKKLIMSLVLVINNLRNLSYLKNLLKDLGARHVKYGTMREHYPMVGAALLKTFESYLGAKWTPEVKQSWANAYEAIVNLMLDSN